MAEIFFFNQRRDMDELLKRPGCPVRYAVLEDFIRDGAVADALKAAGRFEEVKLGRYVRQEEYRKRFIDFISGLNRDNSSVLWWALDFASKHPAGSELPKRVWNLLALEEFLKDDRPEFLAVFTCDKDLVSQFKVWHEGAFRIQDRVRRDAAMLKRANIFLPLYICLAFLRSAVLKIISHILLAARFDAASRLVVLRTLIGRNAFAKDSVYRDTYFGDLPDFVKKSGKPLLIFATISAPFLKNIIKTYRNKKRFLFMTLEQAVTWPNLLRCFGKSLMAYFLPPRLKGDLKIAAGGREIDLAFTIGKVVRDGLKRPRLFSNLLVYYSTLSLCHKVRMERFIYPFENRGWEKLGLIALRRSAGGAVLIGYQHASISLALMNFFMGQAERDVMPLPDRLVTSGAATKEILENIYGLPGAMLKSGCGLRQGRAHPALPKTDIRKRIKNIFVPLALSSEEYVKGLKFLNEAFDGRDDYNIKIRPHVYPVMRIEEALSCAGKPRFTFTIDQDPDLDRSLKEADIVLYFSTTVSLEALTRGIPVVNIDPGFFLSPDPLFGLRDFKWNARTPDELVKTIGEIESLPDAEYAAMRGRACRYAADYITPVTAEKISAFLR